MMFWSSVSGALSVVFALLWNLSVRLWFVACCVCVCVCRHAGGEVQAGQQQGRRGVEEQSEEPSRRTATHHQHPESVGLCLCAGKTASSWRIHSKLCCSIVRQLIRCNFFLWPIFEYAGGFFYIVPETTDRMSSLCYIGVITICVLPAIQDEANNL